MLRKADLKRRDSKAAINFLRHFHILYEFFLELVKLAKQEKWLSLTARGVAGRQFIPVELKISRSCCQFCRKREGICGRCGKMVYGLRSNDSKYRQ